MEFFLTLSEVGQNFVVDIFNNLITFFNTPVNNLLGVTTVTVNGFSAPAVKNSGFMNFVFTIWNWVAPNTGVPKPNSIWTPLVNILNLIGLDTSLPMWSFMLSNLGFVILSSIALRFLSVF